MSGRILLRTGEALVAGGSPGTDAAPEIVIGELDGPVGIAFATLLDDQMKGYARVLAIMNTDTRTRPTTLMVSKVTVKDNRYSSILTGTVREAIAKGVHDAVRIGDIPGGKAGDLGIIVSVWLNPAVVDVEDLDHKVLFDVHRKTTTWAIHKAMKNHHGSDRLLANRNRITHRPHQTGLDGRL